LFVIQTSGFSQESITDDEVLCSSYQSPLAPQAGGPLSLPLLSSTPNIPLHTAKAVKIMAEKKWANSSSLFDQLREGSKQELRNEDSIFSPPSTDHVTRGGRSLRQGCAVAAPGRNERKQKVVLHRRGLGSRKKVLWGKNGMCRGKSSSSRQRAAPVDGDRDGSSVGVQIIIDGERAATVVPQGGKETMTHSPTPLGGDGKKSRTGSAARSHEEREVPDNGDKKTCSARLVFVEEQNDVAVSSHSTKHASDVPDSGCELTVSAASASTTTTSSKTNSVFGSRRLSRKQVIL